MKQNHREKKEQPQQEIRRKSGHEASGFGRVGFIGALGLGVALGLVLGFVLGFFLFGKPMKVVVEVEPKASSSSASASATSSDSGEPVTREEMNEKFEQEIGKGDEPQGYQSTCLIEVRPIRAVDSIYGPSGMPIGPMTKRFLTTQFAIILAPSTLELAMNNIQLDQRWEKDRKEVLGILRKIVSAKPRRGTDLIEISVVHQEKESAQMICKAVYQAYMQRRRDLEIGIRKDQLKAIKVVLQSQSDRAADLRKRLMDIAEKLGIIYIKTERKSKTIGDRDLAYLAVKELYQSERHKDQLTFEINKLLPLNRSELVAAVADLPNADFKENYNKYTESDKEMKALLADGLSEKHPDIIMQKTAIAELEISLEKQAINVRDSMKHQLLLIDNRVKKMKKLLNSTKRGGVNPAREIQEFNITRKEYQIAKAIKEAIEKEYDLEKTKMIMPFSNVIVHEKPSIQEVRSK